MEFHEPGSWAEYTSMQSMAFPKLSWITGKSEIMKMQTVLWVSPMKNSFRLPLCRLINGSLNTLMLQLTYLSHFLVVMNVGSFSFKQGQNSFKVIQVMENWRHGKHRSTSLYQEPLTSINTSSCLEGRKMCWRKRWWYKWVRMEVQGTEVQCGRGPQPVQTLPTLMISVCIYLPR